MTKRYKKIISLISLLFFASIVFALPISANDSTLSNLHFAAIENQKAIKDFIKKYQLKSYSVTSTNKGLPDVVLLKKNIKPNEDFKEHYYQPNKKHNLWLKKQSSTQE